METVHRVEVGTLRPRPSFASPRAICLKPGIRSVKNPLEMISGPKAYRVDDSHHLVSDAGALAAAVEVYRLRVIDTSAKNRSLALGSVCLHEIGSTSTGATHIICDGPNRLWATRQSLSFCSDVLVRNAWVVEIAANEPMLYRVKFPFDGISDVSGGFSGSELVARLFKGQYVLVTSEPPC